MKITTWLTILSLIVLMLVAVTIRAQDAPTTGPSPMEPESPDHRVAFRRDLGHGRWIEAWRYTDLNPDCDLVLFGSSGGRTLLFSTGMRAIQGDMARFPGIDVLDAMADDEGNWAAVFRWDKVTVVQAGRLVKEAAYPTTSPSAARVTTSEPAFAFFSVRSGGTVDHREPSSASVSKLDGATGFLVQIQFSHDRSSRALLCLIDSSSDILWWERASERLK